MLEITAVWLEIHLSWSTLGLVRKFIFFSFPSLSGLKWQLRTFLSPNHSCLGRATTSLLHKPTSSFPEMSYGTTESIFHSSCTLCSFLIMEMKQRTSFRILFTPIARTSNPSAIPWGRPLITYAISQAINYLWIQIAPCFPTGPWSLVSSHQTSFILID